MKLFLDGVPPPCSLDLLEQFVDSVPPPFGRHRIQYGIRVFSGAFVLVGTIRLSIRFRHCAWEFR